MFYPVYRSRLYKFCALTYLKATISGFIFKVDAGNNEDEQQLIYIYDKYLATSHLQGSRFLTPGDGTKMMSRNVVKKLQLLAA